ncbi:hypothetical protein [Desertihabitans brevis]|nr:hypothetical protein [Desertihabitans brevis]
MPERDQREPAEFDRVFAEMTAGWTVEVPDAPEPETPPEPEPSLPRRDPSAWAEDHPLFRHEEAEPEPDEEEDEGHFEKPPLTPVPWGSLSLPALVGAALMTFTVVVLLLVLLGLRFPTPVGYAAVAAFVLGFGLLMTRLHRGHDDRGSGAQL